MPEKLAVQFFFKDHLKDLVKFGGLESSGNNLLHLVVMAHTDSDESKNLRKRPCTFLNYFSQQLWKVV